MNTYPTCSIHSYVFGYLNKKHIHVSDLAVDVVAIQKDFCEGLTVEYATDILNKVLSKRDVIQHMALAIQLDKLAAKDKLDKELSTPIKKDFGLFSCDETLAYGMANNYGNIATTNFGYLDKNKQSVAKRLDQEQKDSKGKIVNTFLDDCISALIACAAAYIAHEDVQDV